MIALLEQVFGAAASAYGGTHKLDYEQGVPAVINDLEVCQRASAVVRERLPRTTVTTSGLNSLIGEDVAISCSRSLALYCSSGLLNRRESMSCITPGISFLTRQDRGFEAIREILSAILRFRKHVCLLGSGVLAAASRVVQR